MLPAFPIKDLNEHPGPLGMTLRDYFAAKALATLQQTIDASFADADTIAKAVFEIADAMLKARDA